MDEKTIEITGIRIWTPELIELWIDNKGERISLEIPIKSFKRESYLRGELKELLNNE